MFEFHHGYHDLLLELFFEVIELLLLEGHFGEELLLEVLHFEVVLDSLFGKDALVLFFHER